MRTIEDYTNHPDLPDGTFDLVVVDGLIRDKCAITTLEKVKPGGYIFFDNSDVPWDEHVATRKTLTEAADTNSITLFDDFCPFQFQVNESMSVRVRGG